MWARRLLLTLALGILSLANTASAGPPEELRFAAIADVPATTMAVRLLSAAYGDLGIRLTTLEVPSRRALLLADVGEVDGDLFRIARVGDQFPNLVRVPHPLLEGRLYGVTRQPGARVLPMPEDRRLSVVVRRGVIIAEQTADELGAITVRADSYRQMQDMLDWGRVDLALVSDIEGFSPLNDSRWDHLHVLPEPVTSFTLYHYLHRRHADLAEPLSKALEQLERNGEKARIIERVKSDVEVATGKSADH